MSLRDSESDFGGRLGALTPRVPRPRFQEPGDQNSGLVDMRALYAASVEQVLQRAQAARARPPVVAFDPVALDEEPFVLPRRRLGWLPVTMVLLVLATAGSLFVASSNIPAALHAKAILVPALMRAKTTIVGVATRAEAAALVRVDRLMGRPLPVATPVGVQPPEAPPVAAAPPPVATTPAISPPAPEVREAKAATDIRSASHGPKHPASANPPATAARPLKAKAAEDAPVPATVKAAPEPAKAPATAPAVADSKPASLEDMIRRAVEAESKHKQ